MTAHTDSPATIDTLLDIMMHLRAPETGCPWDREQNFHTIAPYTLEEAYEVVDAIEREDPVELRDELGDLLFQVVFHAQMAKEAGWFDFAGVVQGICDKMVRRHPHVFGGEEIADAAAQTRAWERHKEREKGDDGASVLAGVPVALPALTRACKLQKKAARVGFDWPEIRSVFEKVEEELHELREEITGNPDAPAIRDEAGDLLFAVVNLLRHAGVEPEAALRHANRKFTRRFRQVEVQCHDSGRRITDTDLETLDGYWDQAKLQEY